MTTKKTELRNREDHVTYMNDKELAEKSWTFYSYFLEKNIQKLRVSCVIKESFDSPRRCNILRARQFQSKKLSTSL